MSGPITWRNINQPSNADAARLMGLATDSVNQGIGEFQQIMADAWTRQDRNRATLKQNTDNRLLDYLQSFQSPAALQQSMQSGEVAAFTAELGKLVDPTLARTAPTERLSALRSQAITDRTYQQGEQAAALEPFQDAAQLAIAEGDETAVNAAIAEVAAKDAGAAAVLMQNWEGAQRTKQEQERADTTWARSESYRARNEAADALVGRLIQEGSNMNQAYTAALDNTASQLVGIVRNPDGSIDLENSTEGALNALEMIMAQSELRPTTDAETKSQIQQGLMELDVPPSQWAQYLSLMDQVQESTLGLSPRDRASLRNEEARIRQEFDWENNGYAMEPSGDPMSKALAAMQQAQESNPKLTEALGDWSNQSKITGEVADVMQNGLVLSGSTEPIPVTSAQVRMALQMIQPTNGFRPFDGFRTDFKKFLREIVSTDAAKRERENYVRGKAKINELYTRFGESNLSSALDNK